MGREYSFEAFTKVVLDKMVEAARLEAVGKVRRIPEEPRTKPVTYEPNPCADLFLESNILSDALHDDAHRFRSPRKRRSFADEGVKKLVRRVRMTGINFESLRPRSDSLVIPFFPPTSCSHLHR
jgi:hypothetical protein